MTENALSLAGRRAIAQHVTRETLLGFDFDGTLAAIASVPEEACLRLSTMTLLRRLSQVFPCAVITGRAREDALQRLRDGGDLEVVGNHGIEPSHAMARFAQVVRGWRDELQARLSRTPGVWVEDKTYSLSVHYRGAPDPELAREQVRAALAQLPGARQVAGKFVVNVVPERAPNKGEALLRCMQKAGCASAVYVGDDVTDEDGFAAAPSVLGIRVGHGASAAQLHLESQEEMNGLLQIFLACYR